MDGIPGAELFLQVIEAREAEAATGGVPGRRPNGQGQANMRFINTLH